MTRYLEPKFSVAVGSEAYRDNWEATFGKKAWAATMREHERRLAVAEDRPVSLHTYEADCECGCNLPQRMKPHE